MNKMLSQDDLNKVSGGILKVSYPDLTEQLNNIL